MKKTKSLFSTLAGFMTVYSVLFYLMFSVWHCVQSFTGISASMLLRRTVYTSLMCSAAISVLYYIQRQNEHVRKVITWAKKKYPKLILGYLISTFCLISITGESIWTNDEVSDVLTIEWTMFWIALTIFLVWNVLIVEYLKKQQPEITDGLDIIQKSRLVIRKNAFLSEIDSTFNTVTLLSINLILLVFSTAFVYIIHSAQSVIAQNLMRCTFYFSTNTIALLFFDILKPLKKEKASLIKNNIITENELADAQKLLTEKAVVEALLDSMDWLKELTPQQKKTVLMKYIEGLQNKPSEIIQDNK